MLYTFGQKLRIDDLASHLVSHATHITPTPNCSAQQFAVLVSLSSNLKKCLQVITGLYQKTLKLKKIKVDDIIVSSMKNKWPNKSSSWKSSLPCKARSL